MKFTGRKKWGAGILLAALLCLFAPQAVHAAADKVEYDGVLGQSIKEEISGETNENLSRTSLPSILGSTSYSTSFLNNSFTTTGKYSTGYSTYYHNIGYEDCELVQGIDVSYWQAKSYSASSSNYRKVTGLDWTKIKNAEIEYAFVRVAARSLSGGSLFEDTCADSHIQGAMENDIAVGVYIFSQALTVKEAQEEADYVLDILSEHPDWDITMPVVFDAETTSGGRLANAKLSKSAMTKITQAFCKKIEDAGYTPMIYGGINMFGSGMDAETLAKSYKLWFARYNNTTTSNRSSGTAYSDVSYGYEFWQYSSTAKVSGYSGNLDINFWYKGSGSVINTGGNSGTAKTVSALKASSSASNTVSLSWSATGTVSGYRIYRYNSSQNAYVYVGETTKKSYTDTGLTPGSEYKYKVCSYWTSGDTVEYSAYSDEASAVTKPGDVKNVKVSSGTQTDVTIAWDSAVGASGYRIYKYNDSTEKYDKVTDVGSSVTSYTFTGLSAGSVNDYKVKAYALVNGVYSWGTASDECVHVTNPAAVTEFSASCKSSTAIVLKWGSVSDAAGYQIYRLNNSTGKFEKIKTVTGEDTVKYTNTGLSSGTTYSYQVRAYIKYDSSYFGEFSDISTMTTAPAKVASLKLTAASKSVTLKWGKVTGAAGYEIYRYNAAAKKYEKIKTIKAASTLTYKNTKLTKGKTYKYKVRAYRTVNGTTYYGAYSAAVKIKAK